MFACKYYQPLVIFTAARGTRNTNLLAERTRTNIKMVTCELACKATQIVLQYLIDQLAHARIVTRSGDKVGITAGNAFATAAEHSQSCKNA